MTMKNNTLTIKIFPITLIAVMLLFLASSCKKEIEIETGKMTLTFTFSVDNETLQTDTMAYTNAAGNIYEVNEVKFFISDITLIDKSNNKIIITDNNSIHYIDNNIPSTLTWKIKDNLAAGEYKALEFRFGLKDEKNKTYTFLNPPESNMFWPDPLGGGYHYMKLNGKYLDENGDLAPMNIHLGIGQNDNHTEFYQNYFTVEFPLNLELEEDATNVIHLNMNIGNWFRNPHTYDINAFGSAIMQNQEAQRILKENGHDVFEVSTAAPRDSMVAQTLRDIMKKASPKPHFYSLKKS